MHLQNQKGNHDHIGCLTDSSNKIGEVQLLPDSACSHCECSHCSVELEPAGVYNSKTSVLLDFGLYEHATFTL